MTSPQITEGVDNVVMYGTHAHLAPTLRVRLCHASLCPPHSRMMFSCVLARLRKLLSGQAEEVYVPP